MVDDDLGVLNFMGKVFLILLSCLLANCASLDSLPQSAAAVQFERGEIGRTGWSEYQDIMFVKGISLETAFMAAKEGLATSGFTIKRGSFDRGFAIGEHGMTAVDWNIVAGVYFQARENGVIFKIIAEGSKDIGLWGDHTARSWPQDIFRGIREYVALEASISTTSNDWFTINPDR